MDLRALCYCTACGVCYIDLPLVQSTPRPDVFITPGAKLTPGLCPSHRGEK